jgi:hypothetical protein
VWSIAFFGVFVGHALTYTVLAWSPAARSAMLASTGHRYLPVAVNAALALAVLGLGATFLGRLGHGRDDVPRFRLILPRVGTFQVSAFVAIEVAERIAANAPFHDLTHVLPVGVVAEFAVAAVVAYVIRLVLRAGDAAAEAFGSVTAATQRGFLPLVPAPALVLRSAGTPVRWERGPPR